MAEAAKPKPKTGGKPKAVPAEGGSSLLLELIFWVVVALFVGAFFLKIFGFGNDFAGFAVRLSAFFAALLVPFTLIVIFISLLLVMAIFYLSHLSAEVSRYAAAKIAPSEEDHQFATENITSPLRQTNERWEKVEKHIESQNPTDWRLAILESDIILDEMLQKMGYKGEGIGEMLKTVEKSDFLTLDAAWEAHKVRNNIAHQGSEFVMSHPEAKRVINLYKQVFEEFFFI